MLKKIISIIKSFFKSCVDSWEEYSKMEFEIYEPGYYVNSRPEPKTEAPTSRIQFVGVSDIPKMKSKSYKTIFLDEVEEPIALGKYPTLYNKKSLEEFKNKYNHKVIAPNPVTKTYDIDIAKNQTWVFNTKEEADNFSKNYIDPYFGKYSEFTNAYKQFINKDLGEPWTSPLSKIEASRVAKINAHCPNCKTGYIRCFDHTTSYYKIPTGFVNLNKSHDTVKREMVIDSIMEGLEGDEVDRIVDNYPKNDSGSVFAKVIEQFQDGQVIYLKSHKHFFTKDGYQKYKNNLEVLF